MHGWRETAAVFFPFFRAVAFITVKPMDIVPGKRTALSNFTRIASRISFLENISRYAWGLFYRNNLSNF